MARRRRAAALRPEPERAATLREVARLAGVSPMTASRALGKPELVAPETAARVRAAAERLAYVPNRVAGGLSSRKSHVVIAVIPSTLNPVFTDMVEALRADLLKAGYELFLGLSDYASRREDELLDAVIGRRPDAIVLTGVVHSPELRWKLERAHIPVVETWDLTPTPIDMLVGFSNERVGRAAADHLLARKRRKLALLMADDQRSQLRRLGFKAALEARGVALGGEVIIQAPSSVGAAREAVKRLLGMDPGIDAVFCSSDQIAMGVLFEASERGLRIPDQLAVVGFGNLSASAHTNPSLTTVAVDAARVGREAARLIVERLGGAAPRARAPKVIDVGSYVLERASS
jgi:LacI family gluconate utilization system Gnt-I transcriptional repressor